MQMLVYETLGFMSPEVVHLRNYSKFIRATAAGP